MGKPKADKRNGQRHSKIILDYASGGGVVDVKQRKCETTINKGPLCDVTCHVANSGGRIVKRGEENKLLVKDKTSPESTLRETSYAETTRQSEICLFQASEGGEINMGGSKIDFSAEAENANVTVHNAGNKGTINLNNSENEYNITIGPTGKYTGITAVGGKFSGKEATFTGKVTQGSLTGNAADRASSSGIPSATDTPTTESSGTPGDKIRVKLRSIAKGVTNRGGVFEPDDKVGDKMEEIKEMLGEEGEIHLFHGDGKKKIHNSKSFRENEIEDGDTIVVKAEVLCTTGAYENKTRQTA